MQRSIQIEESELVSLTTAELFSVDGGLTFREGVYAIDDAARAVVHEVGDFLRGVSAGLSGH